MNKKSNMINQLIVWCLLIIGIVFFLYPFYVDALNHFIDEKRVESMQRKAAETSKEKAKSIASKNSKVQDLGLQINGVNFSQTNAPRLPESVVKEHLMGKITIPRINQDIPLFDYTSEQLLQEGATLVQGTSVPTGEKGETSVIAAHSGLPERKLFTDLDKVKMGDQFVLTVYNKKFAYEVDDIRIVLPEEVESIRMVPGKNLVTLVSCTPYMINTHRLLVTGHKVPYKGVLEKAVAKKQNEIKLRSFAIIIGTTLMILVLVYQIFRTIRAYLLAKQRFDLQFTIIDAKGLAIQGRTFQLYQIPHRKPLRRGGEILEVVSDENGLVHIENLPKQVYIVKEVGTKNKIKIGFKKLKQSKQDMYRGKNYQKYSGEDSLMIQYTMK